jgi:TonB family protein
MAFPVWLDNIIAYCLQIAILAAVGTLLAYVFRLRVPRVSLIYWQVLLIACLLLPALQNWKHPVIVPAYAVSETMSYVLSGTTSLPANPQRAFWATADVIALIFAVGVTFRLMWLALGFLRLRLFLRRSKPFPAEGSDGAVSASQIRIRARFFVSDEIDSPATFGILDAKVILPRSFSEMSEACREAVICHELLHVRRRDWAIILVEEIIRSIFWFHPAVWWLLARIHLSREQWIDYEVVRLTGNRDPYLNSLLEIARSRGRPRAVPAPLFLREHHLVERVALLLKEASMNRLRLAFSVVGIVVLLAGTVRLASAWFPLTGESVISRELPVNQNDPVQKRDSISGGSMQSTNSQKQFQQGAKQPPGRQAQPAGTALAQIPGSALAPGFAPAPAPPVSTIQTGGAKIQLGYRDADLREFINMIAGTLKLTPIVIDPEVKGTVTIQTASPISADDLLLLFNQILTNNNAALIKQGALYQVVPISSALNTRNPIPAQNREPIRVGGNVQNSKLVEKVDPEYPERARRARISGFVDMSVTVDEQGNVTDVRINRGHPLFNDEAIAAVRKWRYSPTLLNGVPVPVITTVMIGFSPEEPTGSVALAQRLNPFEKGIPSGASVTFGINADPFYGSISVALTPVGETAPAISESFFPPQFAFDIERLHSLMKAGGWDSVRAEETSPSGMVLPSGVAFVVAPGSVYTFTLNEAGQILNVQRTRGIDIPGMEQELSHTLVVASGRRGSTAIPVNCTISFFPARNR